MLKINYSILFFSAIGFFFFFCLSFLFVRNISFALYGLTFISILSLGFLLAFFNLNFCFGLLILTLPFSLAVDMGNSGSRIFIPSELIIGIMSVLFFVNLFFNEGIDRKFLRHPVTLLILFYLFFTLISTLYSSMLIVSLKATLVKCCYIIVFYFLLNVYLNKNADSIRNTFLLYGISLVLVIICILYKYSDYGFIRVIVNYMVHPFYSDHTIYAACIAFIIPAFTLFFIFSREFGFSIYYKPILFLCAFLLYAGLFYSYSRAGWLSIIVTLLFSFLLFIKISFRYFLFLFFFLGCLLLATGSTVIEYMKQNQHDSNAKHAGIAEQTMSIASIDKDPSNAERLNRWNCALRMFYDRPLLGFGPGTYQFQYLPYQMESEMTRISVISPYNIKQGRGGTAHSEYLLVLSESGIFSFLSFACLALLSIHIGIKNYYNAKNRKLKIMSAFVLLGLVTYLIHGVFNNFLDTDKAAFLFWGALSIIVTIDTHCIYKSAT